MKTVLLLFCLVLTLLSSAQKTGDKLAVAMNALEKDEQFKHAILGMYIVNSKTGAIVYEHNAQVGLAPASCQKVVTSVSAFEMLGKEYRYKTSVGYDGLINGNVLDGNLVILPSGDPTFGSWRWGDMTREDIMQSVIKGLKKLGIDSLAGDLVINDLRWESQATPRGWIWEDVGNYFGAGARMLNWYENLYELKLSPGTKVGDSVSVLNAEPSLDVLGMVNELTTGPAGSGDRSIIYLPEAGVFCYLRGTIPAGSNEFKISGSTPNPAVSFSNQLKKRLADYKISFSGEVLTRDYLTTNKKKLSVQPEKIAEFVSPAMDTINYWFLKKSINLYGEAFLKTIAYGKKGFGATDTGVKVLKDFWKDRGIEPSALNIQDGSGLSPSNRVTTHALVTVMQYAKTRDWFPSFYNALPEMNGIKMKDGYIGGVRSYTGYIKSKDGNEYTFSLIVNNFSGSPGGAREKMWKLLDLLK